MPSKSFSVNADRSDPYKNYAFLVYFEQSTTPVAGVSKVGVIKRTSATIDYQEGGNAVVRRGLGRTRYDPVTLERGVTHDSDFEDWANAAQVLDKGHPTTSLTNLRKKVVRIELLNEERQPVHRYLFYNCWVSEFQALSDLDAGGSAVVIEHIKIEHEGWEHDLTLQEPKEL